MVSRLRGHGRPAHEVWLPPLDESPAVNELLPDTEWADAQNINGQLWMPIGVVDRPYDQRRDVLMVDLSGAQGNVAVVGGPQSGKSTALLLVLAAAGDGPADLVPRLAELLPAAAVVIHAEDGDITAELEAAAGGIRALGMAGGDGSINPAAGVALPTPCPWCRARPAPSTTWLATWACRAWTTRSCRGRRRDAGRHGRRPDRRPAVSQHRQLWQLRRAGRRPRGLEERIGKWPAVAVALCRVLRHGEPALEVEIDGTAPACG